MKCHSHGEGGVAGCITAVSRGFDDYDFSLVPRYVNNRRAWVEVPSSLLVACLPIIPDRLTADPSVWMNSDVF
jgi:hypothetical protein